MADTTNAGGYQQNLANIVDKQMVAMGLVAPEQRVAASNIFTSLPSAPSLSDKLGLTPGQATLGAALLGFALGGRTAAILAGVGTYLLLSGKVKLGS